MSYSYSTVNEARGMERINRKFPIVTPSPILTKRNEIIERLKAADYKVDEDGLAYDLVSDIGMTEVGRLVNPGEEEKFKVIVNEYTSRDSLKLVAMKDRLYSSCNSLGILAEEIFDEDIIHRETIKRGQRILSRLEARLK